MKHNDISNMQSYVIGFRVENTLIHPKEGFVNSVINRFSNKYLRGEVDNTVLSLMKYIYYNTEMTCVVVIDKENYTSAMEDYLLDFPCSQMKVVLKSLSEVTMMLNTGELTYFVTSDSIEKSLVNSRYAVSVDEINTLIKRRVRRFE